MALRGFSGDCAGVVLCLFAGQFAAQEPSWSLPPS